MLYTDDSLWSEVKGASDYDAALRCEAAANPRKYNEQTWLNDRIELKRPAVYVYHVEC